MDDENVADIGFKNLVVGRLIWTNLALKFELGQFWVTLVTRFEANHLFRVRNLRGRLMHINPGTGSRICELLPLGDVGFNVERRETSLLTGPIPAGVLEAFETERAGGDAYLQLEATADIFSNAQQPTGTAGRRLDKPEIEGDSRRLIVKRDIASSRWAEILGQAGYHRQTVLTFPGAGSAAMPEDVREHLRSALAALGLGEVRQALVDTRVALDVIRKVRKHPRKLTDPPEQRSTDERVVAIEKALFSFASIGPHWDERAKHPSKLEARRFVQMVCVYADWVFAQEM